MSAALVAAALDCGVELQLVTGARADLIRVGGGTEYAIGASTGHLRLERNLAPWLAAWDRYAYEECALGLETMERPRDRDLAARVNTLVSTWTHCSCLPKSRYSFTPA